MAVIGGDFTREEVAACYVAGQMENGDRCFVGANLAIPRAGNLLANLTHAPDLKVGIGLVRANLLNEPVMESTKFSTDYRMARFAEGLIIHNDIFDDMRASSNVFFVGGLQIDRFGNTNLIGIGPDIEHLTLRGPGSLGTVSSAHFCDRYYLFTPVHSPQVLVEKCDFISVFGHGEGGDHRARLQLDRYNAGPTALVTPLAILDFETADHRMRLASVHPGVTVEEVVEATGFELEIPDQVPTTPDPTAEQLELLRTRIDVDGLLRRNA
jgi:glutaconate CoA-transferase, subunit B